MSKAFHVGLPMFYVSLEQADDGDRLEVGAVFDGRYRNIPGAFRKEKLVGGIEGALTAFIDGIDALAGEFSGNADNEGSFDLASLVGRDDLKLVRRGRFIRLVGRGDAEIRFSSESVIVLEVMVALGNELARLSSSDEMRDTWRQVADRCDVLPMDSENWFEAAPLEKVLAEAEWYAGHIGQDLEYYVDAARWLRARQMLYAMKELASEPTREEYESVAMLDLPSSAEIDGLVARAAAGMKQPVDGFVADAISDRNIGVRQEVVFRRWYGSDRQDSTPSP